MGVAYSIATLVDMSYGQSPQQDFNVDSRFQKVSTRAIIFSPSNLNICIGLFPQ
jgi:hypothetical protein